MELVILTEVNEDACPLRLHASLNYMYMYNFMRWREEAGVDSSDICTGTLNDWLILLLYGFDD